MSQKLIVSGSSDGMVLLWTFESLIVELAGHRGSVNSVKFSHNSRYIISGSSDNSVKV